MSELRGETIRDFGEQWTAYRDNEGYYASQELFRDIAGPFADEVGLEGARACDIGSGTGRIVRMLVGAGAAHVLAVEPSAAYDVLCDNVRDLGERVTAVRAAGEDFPAAGDRDLVVSFGVLHHIPDPAPVVRRALDALRPGGKLLVWLYGREGNELYLSLVEPLRRLTTRLPHRALDALSRGLRVPLDAYVWASRRAPRLPMAAYMVEHIGKLSPEVRALTIYDQLNPAFAKYYTRDEARALLEDAGFRDVRLHHRHGYSWTVLGTKP